ncbi:hypothetical protein [Chitinophaga defluvii]|uniref:Uncharacterized protein n=1 Tax=Chitinophaga defluvii TaxID=3163343 RepID=A0ABV2T5V7_9BACT
MIYYIVQYTGPFGFIKPWTAVRDSETFSQQFLTPSMIEGIRQKLEVDKILRYRLTYEAISSQQERTQTRGWEYKKPHKTMTRPQSILTRGVMVNPLLLLAFETMEDARKSAVQHICLCRNEDLLLPTEEILTMDEASFNTLPGFELIFDHREQSFLVGHNRYANSEPMYGWLQITDTPVYTRNGSI